MSILVSHVVVVAKPGQWEQAQEVARRQVENANTRAGTLVYEIYLDAARERLVNVAAYRDADAWLAHVRSNPFAREYMTLVELVSLDVHGDPTPELQEAIAAFGDVTILPPV